MSRDKGMILLKKWAKNKFNRSFSNASALESFHLRNLKGGELEDLIEYCIEESNEYFPYVWSSIIEASRHLSKYWVGVQPIGVGFLFTKVLKPFNESKISNKQKLEERVERYVELLENHYTGKELELLKLRFTANSTRELVFLDCAKLKSYWRWQKVGQIGWCDISLACLYNFHIKVETLLILFTHNPQPHNSRMFRDESSKKKVTSVRLAIYIMNGLGFKNPQFMDSSFTEKSYYSLLKRGRDYTRLAKDTTFKSIKTLEAQRRKKEEEISKKNYENLILGRHFKIKLTNSLP